MISKTFVQLTQDEIYAIAKLRQDVFIVEQNSIYQDLDGLDQSAIHYLLKQPQDQELLLGYGRVRAIESTKQIKIERIVLLKQARGKGFGKMMLQQMLADINQSYAEFNIVLSSQTYACEFYRQLGFVEYGEPYDDGGIEHISMLYTKS
ncbi:GNAT family N-acetyltransferase [Paraglaciecola aquimarina]|uniref:GNAT family N-acetyltransferase n=1 Tax=Paraglaciecola algarum TaxID=3050085 RepID=A0ABS9D231_9ALTE|nr:GNAT family N-acetyltransferase [Paraglaciecola sp. G1-23]MCF2946684.1 GNAT family N-acetyltransferase [Paraglaciecola sp. G1-23]